LGIDVIYLNLTQQLLNDGYDIADFRKIMEEFGSFDIYKEQIEGRIYQVKSE